jgi:hypothetical protein
MAPLLLAIEPDRQRASRLAALARVPLKAELIVSESTDTAWDALAGRVPDLILTSLLLSPRDEAALADRLRELDAIGARVQTLVIPVLGTTSRASDKKTGLLTKLRRPARPDWTPDACDPSVFAAQISEYLERAAAERARLAEVKEEPAPDTPVSVQRPLVDWGTVTEAESALAAEELEVQVATADDELQRFPPLDQEAPAASVLASEISTGVEEIELPGADVPDLVEVKDETDGNSLLLAQPEEPQVLELRSDELESTLALAADPVLGAVGLLDTETDSRDEVITVDRVDVDLEAFVRELETAERSPRNAPAKHGLEAAPVGNLEAAPVENEPAAGDLWMPLPPLAARTFPVIDGLSAESIKAEHVAERVPEPVAPLQVAAPPPSSEETTVRVDQRPERPRAVRTPRAPRTTTAPRTTAAPVPVSGEFHGPPPVKKKQKSRKAVQDEWGFFDPQQCGFGALLKKLDELADSDERGAR